MRKFILKILIRLFFRNQRDIKKLDLGEELSAYKFKEPSKVIDIMKHNRTIMTLWHWETRDIQEANIVKGMALMLNIMIEANEMAVKLQKIEDIEKRLYLWSKFKEKEKTNIWNNIIKAVRGGGAK